MIEDPPEDWYGPLAHHLGSAYLKYSFTKNSQKEADFLFDVLGLKPGARLLDVGTGPGRHAIELAKKGVEVVAIDLSSDFLNVARARALEAGVAISFFEMDARDMPFDEEFDAVMSICEGAFSLGLDDLKILRGMTKALKPGGRLATAAVNVFFVTRFLLKDGAEFDPAKMLYKETVDVLGEDGSTVSFAMWNSCYTPRELEWIANGAGLDPLFVYGISPGDYRQESPGFDHPELLLLARKAAELVTKS